MKIYIPTIGRKRQLTADMLKAAKQTTYGKKIDYVLVVSVDNDHLPRNGGEAFTLNHPKIWCAAKGIRETRQWIMNQAKGKFIMMDDDLQFFVRRKSGTFKKAEPEDVVAMLFDIFNILSVYAHGGVSDRFMAHTAPRDMKVNAKYLHILAYNKSLFPKPAPEFMVEVCEDMQMNLSLLTRGCPNFVLTEWAVDNKTYAEGGCNVWRTHGLEYKETQKFAKIFPELVKVIPEDFDKIKKNWNKPAQSNLKTRVNWKKAAEFGAKNFPRRFPRLVKDNV